MKKLFFHTIIIPNSFICCYHWLTCKVKNNFNITISIYKCWLYILTIFNIPPKLLLSRSPVTSTLSNPTVDSQAYLSVALTTVVHTLLTTLSSLVFQDTTLTWFFLLHQWLLSCLLCWFFRLLPGLLLLDYLQAQCWILFSLYTLS